MRIYLAARYSRREEMLEYKKALESRMHEVTARWIEGGHQINEIAYMESEENKTKNAQFAMEDLIDLMNSDCVISFTEEPRAMSNSRGGRHVEFGAALVSDKKMIIVGHRENVFHFMPQVTYFETFEECLQSFALNKKMKS